MMHALPLLPLPQFTMTTNTPVRWLTVPVDRHGPFDHTTACNTGGCFERRADLGTLDCAVWVVAR